MGERESDMTTPVKNKMKYELITTDGKARRGRLTFDRGIVETPAFMPVGTYGTVKGMKTEEVKAYWCSHHFG